jgi:hypothetical protein
MFHDLAQYLVAEPINSQELKDQQHQKMISWICFPIRFASVIIKIIPENMSIGYEHWREFE